eukprot:8307703-Pyramimonas_sp.AAC.1
MRCSGWLFSFVRGSGGAEWKVAVVFCAASFSHLSLAARSLAACNAGGHAAWWLRIMLLLPSLPRLRSRR